MIETILVENHKFHRYDIQETIEEINFRADLCQCDNQYRSNRKFSGKLSKTCIAPLYADMRVDTKHRRKTWFGWVYDNTTSLEQVGTVEYCSVVGNGFSLTWNTNRSCSDCSRIRSVVSEGDGCPCLVDSNVLHSGVADGDDYDCTLICTSNDDNDVCPFNCM